MLVPTSPVSHLHCLPRSSEASSEMEELAKASANPEEIELGDSGGEEEEGPETGTGPGAASACAVGGAGDPVGRVWFHSGGDAGGGARRPAEVQHEEELTHDCWPDLHPSCCTHIIT